MPRRERRCCVDELAGTDGTCHVPNDAESGFHLGATCSHTGCQVRRQLQVYSHDLFWFTDIQGVRGGGRLRWRSFRFATSSWDCPPFPTLPSPFEEIPGVSGSRTYVSWWTLKPEARRRREKHDPRLLAPLCCLCRGQLSLREYKTVGPRQSVPTGMQVIQTDEVIDFHIVIYTLKVCRLS